MAIISVNGTSIQTAIDAAQPGDTIKVAAGGYNGKLSITKSISLLGDGGAILDGGLVDGTVNIDVFNLLAPVTIRGFQLWDAGAGLRFRGDCKGSLVEYVDIPRVSRMVRNTASPTNDDNGGNAVQFSKAQNVTFRYAKIEKCRAKSYDYGVDGGAFDCYSSQHIHISNVNVSDCVNILELGKGSLDPLNSDITLTDSVFSGRAFESTYSPIPANVMNGILGRGVNGLVVTNNLFDGVDWWAILLTTVGGFTGIVTNVNISNNNFRLFPGTNRMLVLNSIDRTTLTLANNNVWPNATNCVVEIDGVRYGPTDQAKFIALGIGATDIWGPEPNWQVNAATLTQQLATAQTQLVSIQNQFNTAQKSLIDTQNQLNTATTEENRLSGIISQVRTIVS